MSTLEEKRETKRRRPRRRPTLALNLAPTPIHFPVAAPPVWADSRKHGEGRSPLSRHPVAGHRGSLAPLPGPDHRPAKPET